MTLVDPPLGFIVGPPEHETSGVTVGEPATEPRRLARTRVRSQTTHLSSCDSEPVELLPRCVHFLECMDEKVHRLVLLPGAGQVVFGSGVEVEVI